MRISEAYLVNHKVLNYLEFIMIPKLPVYGYHSLYKCPNGILGEVGSCLGNLAFFNLLIVEISFPLEDFYLTI